MVTMVNLLDVYGAQTLRWASFVMTGIMVLSALLGKPKEPCREPGQAPHQRLP